MNTKGKLHMSDYEQAGDLGRIRVERPQLPRKSTLVRFMEKVDIQRSGCWLWTGEIAATGYGGFRHPETKWAHRAAYLLLRGPIPEGLTVDHLCYVKRCVNPDHLDLTDATNNRRRESRGISRCDAIHPNTPTRLKQETAGVKCLECHRVEEQERRARRSGRELGLEAPRLPLTRGFRGTQPSRGGSSAG